MKHQLLTTILLFVILFNLTSVSADTKSDWSSLKSQVSKLYDQSEFSQCEKLITDFLKSSEVELATEHELLSKIYSSLSLMQMRNGDFSGSRDTFEQLLNATEKMNGENHPSLLPLIHKLASFSMQLGEFKVADQHFQRFVTLKSCTGSNEVYLCDFLKNLTMTFFKQGQYAFAVKYSKQLLDIVEQKVPRDEDEILIVKRNLGAFCNYSGDYALAEEIQLNVLKQYDNRKSTSDADLATILNNLGFLYTHQKKYSQALPFYQRALDIREKANDPTDSNYGVSLDNLGQIYQYTGKFKQAQELHERALVIFIKTLGKNSFETATCFSNLASSLDQQEKLETAEEFFLESLKIKQKLIGPIHPELVGTMHELATNYSKQKKYDKAESLYKQTITMAEKTMGCNSPLVFVAIDQLSKLYSKQDKIFHATVLVNLSIAKRNSIKTGQKVTLESLTKDMDKMIQQEEERYRKEKNE